MIKLAKYLKPFLPGVLLSLLLLFGQAICDLNLPNLMSDIVNVGIQQGGIEHASPEAITPENMVMLTHFMPEDEKALVSAHYHLVGASDTKGKGSLYRALYPNMGDSLYVLENAAETRNRLDDAFAQAVYALSEQTSAGMGLSGDDASSGSADIEDTEAYAKQAGILFVKASYEALGMDTSALQTRYIMQVGLYMLLIALLGGIATVLVGFLAARISSGLARNLRHDIFEKVEHFSHHEFDKFSSASLITRCTNDVSQVQMLIGMGLRMMCYAPLMGIGGIIMALNKSISMSWIIALAVLVLIGLVMVVMSVALPRFKVIQKQIDRLNLVSREVLSGLTVIRAFSTQSHERARFDAANRELTDTNLFVQRVMAFMMPAINFIMSGVTLLIVWVGAKQVAASTLQVGDMMAFMQYAMQIIFSFMMISMMFIFVPRAAVSGERIAEVLGTEPEIIDPPHPQTFSASLKGTVQFENVHFRYHAAEEDALEGISFTAKPGQTTAIIGATGSGKSTIANLLMRFYDVTQGRILVDGVDIRQVRQADLRRKIGYVPQKGSLLSGTVSSNIRYGYKDASDAAMEEAAQVAQALDFILDKEERFDTEISQGGTNVSGGQKQRLSIARALVSKPEILVFDDSFSALDFQTDAKLRKALKKYTTAATMLVVAQRVGTIMGAEQIIVLEEGRIVGIGTHTELMKQCPTYFEIASSQLAEQAQGEGGIQ